MTLSELKNGDLFVLPKHRSTLMVIDSNNYQISFMFSPIQCWTSFGELRVIKLSPLITKIIKNLRKC